MSLQTLFPISEDLHPAGALTDHVAGQRPNRRQVLMEVPAEFIELRTESGPVYLRPSRWQRLRFLWTFRHFHALPAEVLSRGDRRLIQKLTHSAQVVPDLPVPREAILGVIEKSKPRARSPKPMHFESTAKIELVKPKESIEATGSMTAAPAGKVKPPVSTKVSSPEATAKAEAIKSPAPSKPAANAAAQGTPDIGFKQWGALGALACVAVVIIFAKLYSVTLPDRKPVGSHSLVVATAKRRAVVPAAAPLPASLQLARPKPATLFVAPEPAVVVRKPTRPVTPAPVALASPEPPELTSSAAAHRLLLTDLPQGHVVKPVVSDPNLQGALRLRALVASDGSVRDVTVLSGDPKLAEAGMRAVRRWHYTQYQESGQQGDAEALIGMNFYGSDAISISSLPR